MCTFSLSNGLKPDSTRRSKQYCRERFPNSFLTFQQKFFSRKYDTAEIMRKLFIRKHTKLGCKHCCRPLLGTDYECSYCPLPFAFSFFHSSFSATLLRLLLIHIVPQTVQYPLRAQLWLLVHRLPVVGRHLYYANAW